MMVRRIVISLLFLATFFGLIAFCAAFGAVTAAPDDFYNLVTAVGWWMQTGIALLLAFCILWAGGYIVHWWISRQIDRSQQKALATKSWREAVIWGDSVPRGGQYYRHTIGANARLKDKLGQAILANVNTVPGHLAQQPFNGDIHIVPMNQQAWTIYHSKYGTSSKTTIEIPQQLVQGLPHYVPLERTGAFSIDDIYLGVGREILELDQNAPVLEVPAPEQMRVSLPGLKTVAIGGAIGFGKSSLLQNFAIQVLNSMEQPEVYCLDPQGVSFTAFAGAPNLAYSIAQADSEIFAMLHHLFRMVNDRSDQMARWSGIDNWTIYNRRIAAEKDVQPIHPVVMLFDEFLQYTRDSEISKELKQVLRLGRKTGVMAVVAAQTWNSQDIETGLRSNLVARIQLHVPDSSQSRVLISDSRGTELDRAGLALVRLPGKSKLYVVQTPDPKRIIDAEPIRQLPAPTEQDFPPLPAVATADDFKSKAQNFWQMVNDGLSKNKACQNVFGRSYAGNLVGKLAKYQ